MFGQGPQHNFNYQEVVKFIFCMLKTEIRNASLLHGTFCFPVNWMSITRHNSIESLDNIYIYIYIYIHREREREREREFLKVILPTDRHAGRKKCRTIT